MFRALNQSEFDTLAKARKRGKVKGLLNEKRVRYDFTGNFCVCVLKVKDSVYTGVAKFNPNDKAFSQAVAEKIAFTRAVSGH